MGYVCLHTNGEDPLLFKQKRKGFQIWTAKALREKGFSAENAPYYAVICFDSTTPIPIDQPIDLHKKRYTQVAHILPFGDFVSVE